MGAFAPASVANVAVGFDILGFAFPALGDRVFVSSLKGARGQVTIEPIQGFAELPLDPMKNTATRGLLRLMEDLKLKNGFSVRIEKGIPIGSGLGGSSASAVACLVAANGCLPKPLSLDQLLPYCLDGEEVASGARHGDNIVPCLYGGFQLVRSLEPRDLVALPTPSGLFCVVVQPRAQVETKAARAILETNLSLKKHVEQSGNLAAFIAALYRKDFALLGRSLRDVVIEPQRRALIPGFELVQSAALRAGALGCSISGSGPSIFALCEGQARSRRIRAAMLRALHANSIEVFGAWVSPLKAHGSSKKMGAYLL